MPAIATSAAVVIKTVIGATLTATGVGATTAYGIGSAVGTFVTSTGFLLTVAGGIAGALAPQVDAAGSPTEWKADPDAGIPFIVGRRAVAGNIVHRDEWGSDNRYQSIVTVYSGAGPVNAFGTFTADGETCSFAGSYGRQSTGTWNDIFWRDTTLGAQPETALQTPADKSDPTIAGSMPAWGASYKLSGKAASMLTMAMDKDRERWPNGEPQPLQLIEGILCWDPRLDSTYPGGSGDCRLDDASTWVYSENPYLHALKWCLGYFENDVLVGGIGAALSGIDVPAFVEGANVADANDWGISGQPTTKDDKHQVLLAMLQAGGGIYMRKAGKISCMVRTPRSSIVTVTAADTAGPFELEIGADRLTRRNTIIPRCVMETHDWEMVAQDPVSEASYVTADGGTRESGIDYPYVAIKAAGTNRHQPAQLAAYDMVDSRETIRGTVPMKPHMAQIEPGDVFTIDEPGFLLDGVECLCMSRVFEPATNIVRIGFVSESSGKHTYALGLDPTPPTPPALTAPDIYTVAAPDADAWTPAADTGDTPGITVTGGTDIVSVAGIVVEYRPELDPADDEAWDDADSGWQVVGEFNPSTTTIPITGLAPSTAYDVAVSYISQFGVRGDRRVLGPFTTGSLVATDAVSVGGVASDRVAQAVDDGEVMAEVIIREALDRRDRIQAEIDGVWDTFGTANAFLLEVQDWTDQAEQFSIVASSSATTAGNSATAAAGYRDQALTYADNAGNSASAASTSATAAAASETAAGNSATAASGFSGTAQTAATAAGDSASAAAVSATAASDSATAAGNSATAAGGFASDAETQATAAGDSASSASTSATAAASSATAAGNSATAASGSASTASTAATAAGDSASAASTSATAAASSATAAGNSATAASGFSSTAETAATAAGDSASAASTSATAAASASDAAGDSATAASGFASDASASATEAGEEAAATLTLRTEAQTAASNAATSATQAATASTNAASSATAASNSATAAGNSATASSGSAATADTHRAAAEANAVLAAQYGASSKTDVIDAEDFFTSDLAGLDYSAAAFTGWTEDSISSVGPVVYSTTSTISFGSRARFNPKPGRRYRVTAIWRWTTGTVGTVSVGFRADPLVTGSATNRWSAVTAGSVNEWREASYEITATEGMAEESWRPVIYRTGNTGRIEVRALVWEDLSAFRAAGEDATTVYSTAEEAYAARLIQTSAGAASATISMVARQSDGSAASRIIIAANTIAFGDDELVEITDAGEIIGWDATRAVKMLHWDPENETLQIRKSDGTLQWDSDLGGVTIDGVPGESRTQIGSLGIGTNVTLSGTTLVCDSDIDDMYASGAITCSGYLFISTGDDATGSSQTGSWDLTLTKTGETPVVLVSGTYTTSQATPTEDFEAVIPLAFVEPIPFGGDVTLQLNAGSTGTASGRIRLTRSL